MNIKKKKVEKIIILIIGERLHVRSRKLLRRFDLCQQMKVEFDVKIQKYFTHSLNVHYQMFGL